LRSERPLDSFDGVALERAATLVGLTLLHEHDEQVPQRWSQVWRDVRRELDARHTPALLGGAGKRTLLVFGLGPNERREAVAERAAELIRATARPHLDDDAAVVVAGAAVRSWSELSEALARAIDAVPAAEQAPPRTWHDAEAPDIDRLLWSLRDRRELADFVEARLGPVMAHDRRRAAKLLPTLEALCANGGRKAATARALHLERPSLYHRLARLEQLLGGSLADEDTLFGAQLALRARRHLEDA